MERSEKSTLNRSRDGEIIIFAFATVIYFVLIPLSKSGSFLVNFLNSSTFVPGVLGFALIWYGLSRRTGEQVYCTRCGFERNPTGSPTHCPRCFCNWSRGRNLMKGRYKPSLTMTSFGALILVAAISAGFMGPIKTIAASELLIPSALLIDHICASEVVDDQTAWEVLSARDLSRHEDERLFNGLLMKRKVPSEAGELSAASRDWMSKYARSDRVSDKLKARYFYEMIEVLGIVPDRVRILQPARLGFLVKCNHISTPQESIVILLEGIYLNNSWTRIGRRELPVTIGTGQESKERMFTVELAEYSSDSPGWINVRIIGWILVGPGHLSNNAIAWNNDGTPVIPPEVLWSKRIEIEESLGVTDM